MATLMSKSSRHCLPKRFPLITFPFRAIIIEFFDLFLWGAKSDACVHHVQLEKVYDPTHEEDDMMEMEEERLRMREHVMNEVGATEFFLLLKILFQRWFTSNHVFVLSIGRR